VSPVLEQEKSIIIRTDFLASWLVSLLGDPIVSLLPHYYYYTHRSSGSESNLKNLGRMACLPFHSVGRKCANFLSHCLDRFCLEWESLVIGKEIAQCPD